ncbi:MAG TPA: hypothetical protein VHU18_03480 [Rhizomicrobium sp.]|nr:hypothetical protein [Rhizomicrobium sp.]
MRSKFYFALSFSIAGLLSAILDSAQALCPLPNQITNGQVADATQVMGNFNALKGCIETPVVPSVQFSGPGGGIVTMQNPSATTNYNFNLPATAGNAGNLLTSGGGASNPETWTSTGTSGHALPFLDGSNVWSGTQSFGSAIGTVSTQSGVSYTLAASDCGTTILFTNNSAITLTTLNSLPPGCSIGIEQAGNGQVTVLAGTSATQHSAHGYTKTFGLYALLGLFVDINPGGAAADFIITGDGA